MLKPGPSDQSCRITIEQAEADYFARVEIGWFDSCSRREQLKKPFGFNNARWEELKGRIRDGDELWEFCSSEKSWDMLMGSHTIELRRDGNVVDSIVLAMN
jgi:hypothetical protein